MFQEVIHQALFLRERSCLHSRQGFRNDSTPCSRDTLKSIFEIELKFTFEAVLKLKNETVLIGSEPSLALGRVHVRVRNSIETPLSKTTNSIILCLPLYSISSFRNDPSIPVQPVLTCCLFYREPFVQNQNIRYSSESQIRSQVIMQISHLFLPYEANVRLIYILSFLLLMLLNIQLYTGFIFRKSIFVTRTLY